MKNIGKILRIARHAHNKTVKQISSISGVSSIYIQELEHGKKTNISDEYLAKLSKAYNLSAAQFIELLDYYDGLNFDEDRQFRLTLLRTLEMIESNFSQ